MEVQYFCTLKKKHEPMRPSTSTSQKYTKEFPDDNYMNTLDLDHQPLFDQEVSNSKNGLLIHKPTSVATAATDSQARKQSHIEDAEPIKKNKRFSFIPQGKRLRCLPSRKKKNVDTSISKRRRLREWWTTSVMPTCLTRRRNGEGRFSKKDDSSRRSTKEAVELHDIEVPILHRNVQIVQPPETKPAAEEPKRPSKRLQQKATIQLARTVLPPPPSEESETRPGSIDKPGAPAEEVVIPRGLSSEADLGKRRSLWKFKRNRKGVLPVQHKVSDMYKEVIPNDTTNNNPMWSKAP
eukprot:Protomagalhaensia_sp_Gyna_25__5236@NODE_637_length_2941_cov_339_742247_g496_i0_p2_GENE_NODE_637_length_2941_cov_339_742247_g496_i0NODE_637_length_2941_cov_339_742247_g496_i0_p2_ORF_typecomplete_len294_score46_13_NODE_637_length_2941_cov_339_742247_g496_i09771858